LGGVEVLFDEDDSLPPPSLAVLQELDSPDSTFLDITSLRVEKAPGESSADYGERLAIALPLFRKLCVLNLSSMGLRSEVFDAVCPVLPESLEDLDLSENLLSESVAALGVASLVAALPRLRRLRRLNVSHTGMDAAALSAMCPVLPRTLAFLDLSSNSTNDRAVYASLAASLPPRLVQLRMTNMECDDACVTELARHLPRTLRELLLSNNEIGPKGMAALARALPEGLEVLCLRSNPLGDKGALTLAGHLPGLPSLKHLFFNFTEIHEKGAAALCSVLPERLEELELVEVVLGEAGTRALVARLPGLRFLRILELVEGGLTNKGMAMVAPSLPESLVELGLHGNPFTCEGMGPLLVRSPALRHLKRLTLPARCPEVLEELRRQIPQCYIHIG